MERSPGTRRIADCTGVLIAGGRANRLGGFPKGLLRIDGEPIIARSLRLFREIFADALVVANDPEPYAPFGARIVPDLISGKGAPGGLHAALAAARTEWVFTAACDMPFLRAEPIAWLWDRCEGAPAVAVLWRGRLEPLHAFWSRRCLPVVERRLNDDDPSMWQIATAVGSRFVPEEEWQVVDPDGSALANVNTSEDVMRLGIDTHGVRPGRK